MEQKRIIVKLMILTLLLYWLSRLGATILLPVYLVMILFYVLSLRYLFIPHQETLELIGIFILGALIRAITIIKDTNPTMDVYWSSTRGFEYLLKGVNPYSVIYSGPPEVSWAFSSQMIYGYPPLMLLILGFGYLLSDVRYSVLLADLAVALLLYRLSKDKNWGFFLATSYMLSPFGPIIVRYAWNESVLTAFLLYSILMFKEGKNNLSSVFLGLCLGIKQFSVLLLPHMWRNYAKTQIVISIIVGLIIYLPFLVWSPLDLIHDLFLHFNYVRYDSLSVIPFLLRPLWSNPEKIPAIVQTGLSIIQLGFTGCVMLLLLEKSTTAEKIAYNFSLTYLIFLLLSKIANPNYYHLLFPFFALGIEDILARGEGKITVALRRFFSSLTS